MKICNGWLAVSLVLGSFFATIESRADTEAPPVRIAQFDGDRAAAISYTFDDGIRDQFTLAVPMLNEVGFKGTFFVIPGATAETLEQAQEKDNKSRSWGGVTWAELKTMAEQGHEIASHTWSHTNMKAMPLADAEAEFSKSNEAIKTHIGQAPLTLAFPFNASTPELKAVADKYYVAYRTYQSGISGGSTVESTNTWADKLVRDKKWGVWMFHAIVKGYAALSDAEILRTHLKYVKSREKDIWVDTFANIARYEKERQNTTLKVTGGKGRLICELSSTLDPQQYDVPLTLVVDVPGATSVRAERAGKTLPLRLENGRLYVQAAPNEQPITITWK